MARQIKSVSFNLPQDRQLLELANSIKFSDWVKQKLQQDIHTDNKINIPTELLDEVRKIVKSMISNMVVEPKQENDDVDYNQFF